MINTLKKINFPIDVPEYSSSHGLIKSSKSDSKITSDHPKNLTMSVTAYTNQNADLTAKVALVNPYPSVEVP